jgi:hypothetical protein
MDQEYINKLSEAGFFVDDRLNKVFLDGEYVGELSYKESKLNMYATLTYPLKRIATTIKAAEILEENKIPYFFRTTRQLQLELTTEVAEKHNLLTRLNSLKIIQQ